METRSALIVGAGITGISAAEWLRRDGWHVTLIDPVHPGDSRQASFGNAGLIARTSIMPVATPSMIRKAPLMVFDPNSPLFLRWGHLPRLLPWLLPFIRNASAERIRDISRGITALTFDANEQHQMLSQGTGAETFISRGEMLTLFQHKTDFTSDRLGDELRKRYALDPELLDRNAILQRDARVGPSYNFATLFRDMCWLSSPQRYLEALFGHVRQNGVRFRQTEVMSITPGERPSVVLAGGETLVADKVVLSAGVWSRRLAKTLGLTMKMEGERGYHIAVNDPAFTAPGPYFLTDAKAVVTPMDGFLRVAGISEFASLTAPPSKSPLRLIENALRRLYPTLDFNVTESWMGRRPTTPDSLPVLGESAERPNIIHAYGGQHIGLTIGPKLGRLVAEIAGSRKPNTDLTPYHPDRFLARKGPAKM